MRASVAPVEPMVLSPVSGDPLPLLDLVRGHVGQRGRIAIVGGRRSGKTTAIAHLRAHLENTVEFPGVTSDEMLPGDYDGLVVYAWRRAFQCEHLAVYGLLPWGDDQVLEYLMARHRDRCASVMARLGGHERLAGNPELWCAVLDTLAAHESVPHVPAALARLAAREPLSSPLSAHRQIRLAREAIQLVLDVRDGAAVFPPVHPDVVREAAPQLADDREALDSLRAILRLDCDERQAVAASLLHFAGGDTSLPPSPMLDLTHAYVPGIDWAGVRFGVLRLDEATLTGADLRRAALDHASLSRANLARADLTGASLCCAHATYVNLQSAKLSHADAADAYLIGADLRRADLSGAQLERADLSGADLRDARLERAHLRKAILTGSQVRGADFRGADCTGASLVGLQLHEARLEGACFDRSVLRGANLSSAQLDRCRMARARLEGADLTDASLRGAALRGAVLQGARAGGLDAEGADLRNADLTRMTFHFGSSRSGRLDSDIASEGTRTGFYTDEYEERHFKAPEEIRVANLRGADLRGATVDETDFYLVDLRDAQYDAEQELYFRRCRAILSARV